MTEILETLRLLDVGFAVDFEEYESSDIHILADSDLADEKGLKEGDIDKEQIENPEFGRIAAQVAKQVIVRK